VVKDKPAWTEAHKLRVNEGSKKLLDGILAGTDEEIRLRAAMMASVDESTGDILKLLEEQGELDNTFILFLGDNGYFFGEHGLGPERRFAYEEGIKAPFLARYPAWFKPGSECDALVTTLDIAPTCVDLAGGKGSDYETMQGLSLRPLAGGKKPGNWRKSFLCEYFSENAMPWLIGMSYKAIRTVRYKYIHWTQKSLDGVACDELYDLKRDPYEMKNLVAKRSERSRVTRMRKELAKLVAESVGL
jgi:arylsulfatase A-like enzyme